MFTIRNKYRIENIYQLTKIIISLQLIHNRLQDFKYNYNKNMLLRI